MGHNRKGYGPFLCLGESMYTLDFETAGIVNGSNKSPEPCGFALKQDGKKSIYISWNHPGINEYCKLDAQNILNEVWLSDEKIMCHNSKFDLRVALEWFNLPVPEPSRIIDTMIMAYLIDAREASLSLKPLAEKYCNMPPDDQSKLNNWLIKNGHKPGRDICKAPAELVGPYACSDVDMTYALYKYLESHVLNGEHIELAFNREMAVLPIVIDMEARGINISKDIHDIRAKLEKTFELQDLQLTAYGDGEKPGSKAMFNVLRRKGLIDESKIEYTPKGNPRYGKDFLEDMIADKELVSILKLRGKLQKFIGTYLKPFSESSSLYGFKFYPYYNQTRSEDDFGTRTGRFSSNIQQLPKDSGDNFTLYAEDDSTINAMPSVRSLIVPSDDSMVLIKRDFSGQELRVVAHYAEGSILKAYQDDPKMDVHAFVDNLIQEMTGHHLSRTPVKMINFLKLYGGGPAKLAERLKIPVEQARTFFRVYDEALPEFKGLMKDIENLARSGKKIRTWGGRSYLVEPPSHDPHTGRRKEFYYKLGNVLIQGSSADMTKEAMIRYFYHPNKKGNLLMTVHDEIVIEVHKDFAHDEMKLLKWAMDDIPGWDVPLCSDGAVGINLGKMEAYVDE
jgi:DNA polymerase-1